MATHVYCFGNDFTDFFNQLKTHPATHWQSCLVTLPFNDVDSELVYVLETVLGFGVVCGSNVAQRLADALVWLFHKWFDEEEDALLDMTQSAYWLSWRASKEASCTQSVRVAGRLYCIHIYTDDGFAFIVGPNRQWCATHMWATVVKRFNLLMATAIKRQCGTVLTALGASVSTVLALVQLQKAKTLAVLADLTELLQGRMQAAQRRRVLGKLQHFHFIVRMDNSYFDGMRRPTAAGQELSRGLSAVVRCNPLIFYNTKRWMKELTSVAGASVAAVLPEPPEYASVPACFVMSSDAALRVTPPEVPGMGGYLAGYTWQLTLHHASALGDVSSLHIGALELLAFAGNVIMFHGLLALGLGLDLQGGRTHGGFPAP